MFDTLDGVRLGISTEEGRGTKHVHISASLLIGGPAESELVKLPPPPNRARARAFVVKVETLIAEITGRFDFQLLGSTASVFHWLGPVHVNRPQPPNRRK